MASTYYFLPTRNVFGEGSSAEAGTLLKTLNAKKTLIVTDKFLASCGMAGKIQAIFEEAGIQAMVFDGAEPNPTDKNVEAGLEAYRANGCDSIVSLGGGSSHDCAKGIGLVAANGGEIYDYEGVDKSKNDMVPLMAINTTAGTASEITRFCIITDTRRKVKMAIVDWKVTPQISINDPELMKGMPAGLTAATGMDALTHAIEGLITLGAWEMSDMFELKAIEMIAKWLPKAVETPSDIEARDAMATAQYIAGMAFSNVGLGLVHGMAHPLGAFYDIPHGVANALLLPYVMEFNMPAAKAKYRKIAEAMGIDTAKMSDDEAAQAAVDAVKQLSISIKIPQKLSELNVKEEDLGKLAESAFNDVCTPGNPRKVTVEEIKALYTKAF